jgi:PAS domain S-box-containing protein
VSTDCIELQKKLEKTQAILAALHQGELDAIVRSDDVALIRNEEIVRNTEYALEESRNNFQLLFDTLDDLLFIIDIKGNIKHFNMAVQEVLGYSINELQSMNFLDLHKKEEHCAIQKLLKGESQIIQNELIKKNNEIIYAETRFSKGAWSQHPVWFAIVRDISIRKQAELEMKAARKAAEEADQAKTEFFAKMTHELRTPLNGILGYSQILINKMALNDPQKKAVSVIKNSGEYLLGLINDLLDFSTLEAQKMDIYLEAVDFPPLIQYICEMGAIQAKQKKIGFNVDIPGKIPEKINTDEKRLQQILLNLLGNAIKYTDQGYVRFSVQLRDDKIRFCIQDTGCGIATDQKQFIFQAFNRIKDKNQQKEGTGLGLYISQKLLHMMGSDLTFESTERKGTKVWFDLDTVFKSKTTIKSEHLMSCEQDSDTHQPLTYPPRHLLDLILEFTMSGDIQGILEWIDLHMNDDPAYKPFFQTIKEMALDYKITDIQHMIEGSVMDGSE